MNKGCETGLAVFVVLIRKTDVIAKAALSPYLFKALSAGPARVKLTTSPTN